MSPVEEKIRANFEERRKSREAWQAKREERRAEKKAQGEDRKGREKLALPDRIEKRSERLTKQADRLNARAAKAKEFAEALKPLYATFSEEQKAVAGRVLNNFGQGGKQRGPRWAMGGGRHGHGHGFGRD